MNIFVTHPNYEKAAKYLDIKRQNKMLIESVQMLSTAVQYHGGIVIYKPTHVNHPCNVWVRENVHNFLWLEAYALHLSKRYLLRTGKTHASGKILLNTDLHDQALELITHGQGLTPFVNCTSDYKDVESVYDAYKLQLLLKWENDTHPPRFDGDFEDVYEEFERVRQLYLA